MREGAETDLTREEVGSPTPRADVRIEVVHQVHEMQVHWGSLRLRSFSVEPVDSPSGTATAVLKIACAGSAAAVSLATAGHVLGVPRWCALILTVLPFLLVVLGAGHLIRRGTGATMTSPGPHLPETPEPEAVPDAVPAPARDLG